MYIQNIRRNSQPLFVENLKPKIINPCKEAASNELLNKNHNLSYVFRKSSLNRLLNTLHSLSAGGNNSAPELKTYCGDISTSAAASNRYLKSTGQDLFVTFHSDETGNNEGFSARVFLIGKSVADLGSVDTHPVSRIFLDFMGFLEKLAS